MASCGGRAPRESPRLRLRPIRRQPPRHSAGRHPARRERRSGRIAGGCRRIPAPWPRGTPLSYSLLRLGSRQALEVSLADRHARPLDVLRARGGRPVYAARRRVGPASTPARSGHAAFFLAVRRVLRRVHVLVQRPVRSTRLDVLLGRCGGHGAAAAAAAALHAGVPRSAPRRGPLPRASAARRSCICRRCVLGARRIVGDRAAARRTAQCFRARSICSIAPSRSTCSSAPSPPSSCWCAAFGEITSLTGRRQLRWIAWGIGARRRAVRARICAAVGARLESAACAAVDRYPARPRAAGVRVRDRALPPARRRSHHQARRWRTRRFWPPAPRCISRCASSVGFLLRRRCRPAQLDRRAPRHDRRRAAGAAGQGGGAERARSHVLSRSLRLPARARRLRARPEQRSRRRPSEPAAGRRASSKRWSSTAWR